MQESNSNSKYIDSTKETCNSYRFRKIKMINKKRVEIMTSQQHPIINFRETYKAKLRSMTDLRVNGSLSSLDWSREHNEKAFWECGGKKLISSTRIHRHKGIFFGLWNLAVHCSLYLPSSSLVCGRECCTGLRYSLAFFSYRSSSK